MALGISRPKRAHRHTRSEKPAVSVAKSLNEMDEGKPAGVKTMRPGKVKLITLIKLCQAYCADGIRKRELAQSGSKVQALVLDTNIWRQIQNELRLYRVQLTAGFVVASPGGTPAFPDFRHNWQARKRGPTLAHAVVVPKILEAMKTGQIMGLRVCCAPAKGAPSRQCGRWFYSAKPEKLHCSTPCGKRIKAMTPEGHESNRKRQKKWYDKNRRSEKPRMVQERIDRYSKLSAAQQQRVPDWAEWVSSKFARETLSRASAQWIRKQVKLKKLFSPAMRPHLRSAN